jgi:hypothetical protein
MKVREEEIKIDGRLIRIGRLDGDKYKFVDDPEVLLNGLRGSGTRIDLFTFMQRVSEPSPKFQYPMEMDNLAVLPVSTFDHWWTHQIGSNPRNRARQAERKGATVREVAFDEDLVQGIWEVYNECPIRQGTRFLHYGKDVGTVREMSATYLDSSIFVGVFLSNKLIGFAKLVADETWSQANLMHVVSMVGHKEKAPTNALIAQAVRSCAARGIRYLVYQNYSYGNKTGDGLSRFKEVNGFRRIDLPRYYVPLTLLGGAALRLGLHKKLATYVPEPMLDKLRELRSAWYSRKFQTVTDAL